jgi:MFS family permease
MMVAVAITQIFTFSRWGKHADKVGNVKVLRFTSFIIAAVPFWWILNQHPGYLMFAQALSGFAWSGFNLCAVNFIYDAVTPEKRTRCFAYFNFLNGLALCLGALLGGYLLNVLPVALEFKILSLFCISSILRFVVVFLFSGRIKEVRPAQKVKSRDLFYSVIGLRPILGISE